ncbi:MAG: CRISPR-associated endoribonuclease Cas6 [Ignavibacteria bacterium]|nr:CRISPR-associated endoribonuclease Cas6 [Ignavibacteria bacterium]
MRLEIRLKSVKRHFTIPVNYNYPLGSALYQIFYESSPSFSKWLHDKGFITPDGKKLKLFTFSRLFFKKFQIEGDKIHSTDGCWFLFSSPFEYSIIENFLIGAMIKRKIVIANNYVGAEFILKSAGLIPEPEFSNEMNYLMLSPTVSSTVVERNNELVEHYYRVDEIGVEENLANNLKKKYEIVFKKEYVDKLEIILDKKYIETKGGAENVSKLITLAEGKKEETKVKGFLCPVKIFGNPSIQRVAYECGIGQKNSMGFGMLDVAT